MSFANVFTVKDKVKVIATSISMYAMHIYRHEQFESISVAKVSVTIYICCAEQIDR